MDAPSTSNGPGSRTGDPGARARDPVTRNGKRVWMRRALVAALAVVVLAGIAAVTAPAWLSGSIGRSLVASAIGGRVSGTVTVADVQLSWPGPQRITGLVIAGAGGDRIAADIDVDAGLWGLVQGTVPLRVTLGGSARTRYSDDGTFSIMKMLAAPGERSAAAQAGAQRAPTTARVSNGADPITLPEIVRGASLTISGITVEATSSGSGPAVAVRDLAGSMSLTDGNASVELEAKTALGTSQGRIGVRARVTRLWNVTTGGIDPWSAGIAMSIEGESLPLPAAGMPLEARSIEFTAAAVEIGRELTIAGSAEVEMPGGTIGRASTNLTIVPSRTSIATPASVSGSALLQDMPTSLIAPYLAGTPIDVMRDIGATCDAAVRFTDRSGVVQLNAPRVQLSGSIALSDDLDRISLADLSLATTLDPALMESLGAAVDAPVGVRMQVARAQMSVGSIARNDFRGMAIDGVVQLTEAGVRAGTEAASPWIRVGPTSLTLSSKDLAAGADAGLRSSVLGSPVSVTMALTGLLDAAGAPRIEATRAKGSVEAGPVDPASVPWIDDALRTRLADAGISRARAVVHIDGTAEAGSIKLALEARNAAGTTDVAFVQSVADWAPGRISVKSLDVQAVATVSMLAPMVGPDIALADSVAVRATVEPFELARRTVDGKGSIELPSSLRARVELPRVALAKSPGIRGAATLADTTVQASVALDRTSGDITSIDAEVASVVRAGVATAGPEAARVAARYRGPADAASFRASAEVSVSEGNALANLIDSDAAAALAVGPGSVSVTASRDKGTDSVQARMKLPRISGEIDASVAEGSVVVRPSTLEMDVPTQLIESALGMREGMDLAAALADARAPRIRANVRVESVRWTGSAEDAAAVMTVKLGSGTLSPPGRPPVTLEAVECAVSSPRLAQSARANLTGRAGIAGAAPQPFSLSAELAGDLRALIGEDVPLALAASGAQLEMPGSLALALADWWRGSTDTTDAVGEIDRISLDLRVNSARLPSPSRPADAALDATVAIGRIRLVPKDRPAVAIGPTQVRLSSPRIGDRVSLSAEGAAAIADAGTEAALKTTGQVTVQMAAMGLAAPDGSISADRAQLSGSVRASGFPTSLPDAFLGMKGDLVDALGPSVTLELDARTLAPADAAPRAANASGNADAARDTELTLVMSSPQVQVEMPRALLSGGLLSIAPSQPMQGSVRISRGLKTRILDSINPVFSDIVSAPPIRWRISSMQFPTDMDMRKLNASASVEVGEVRMRPSSDILGSLLIDTSSTDGTVPAVIDPLRIEVAAGQLRYRDFKVNAGRIAGDWQQKVSLAAHIDLTQSPPYARSIAFRVPLQSVARTVGGYEGIRSEAEQITRLFQGLPLDPLEVVVVDFDLSGPLGEVNGKRVPLTRSYTLEIDKSRFDTRKVSDAVLDAAGKVIDLFKKKPKK